MPYTVVSAISNIATHQLVGYGTALGVLARIESQQKSRSGAGLYTFWFNLAVLVSCAGSNCIINTFVIGNGTNQYFTPPLLDTVQRYRD